MVRIDLLVFGYRRLNILPEKLSELTSIFIRSSISSRINSDGSITIRERDYVKIQALLSGRVDFEASDVLGIPGIYKRLNHKVAYILGVFFSCLLVTILSSMVWDIRVEENQNISDSEIILCLSENGFSIGDFWYKLDLTDIETKVLENSEKISWININRRGTVAYVKLMEKEVKEEQNSIKFAYANLLASQNCVIEEISVIRGTAVVKPGDVVKKGDPLIVGVLPEGSGSKFCLAEGNVVGRVNQQVSVKVDRKNEYNSISKRKIYSISLNFFKISLNIFKLYGNLTNKYDIIETEKTYSLPGGHRLPFSITIKYIPIYTLSSKEYTDEEIVRVASSRMDSLLAKRLISSDILSLKTYGEFIEDGYIMTSDIVFLTEVTEQVEMKME